MDIGRNTQIDKAAASRIISNSIPKRQRLPASTSGAAVARKQAEAAVNEQGTSSRFRHIAKDADVERVIAINQDEDEDEDEDEEDNDDMEDGAEAGDEQVEDEAEDLLNDLQEQYLAQAEGSPPMGVDGETDRKKRKRAEDL